MRVLIVNTLYPPAQVGGAERSVAQLAQGLTRAGVEASVLTLKPGRETVNERIDGVPVQRLPLRNLYWPYDGARRPAFRRAIWHGLEAANSLMDDQVDRAVARVRPDLIHLHLTTGFSLSVYRAATRRDLPMVQTLRDWSMLCARASLFRRGRRCERRCGSCVLLTAGKRARSQGVNHVIGLSGPVLETHRAAGYFRRTPGSVIGNAAGAAAIAPRPSLAEAPTMRFGFLGRIEPEKGIEVLLAATRRLDDARGAPQHGVGRRSLSRQAVVTHPRLHRPRVRPADTVPCGLPVPRRPLRDGRPRRPCRRGFRRRAPRR